MQFTRRKFSRMALAGVAAGPLLLSGLAAQTTGQVHVVQRGDTLSHLALRYHTSVGSIKQANGLKSDLIRVGQKLNIPGEEAAADFLGNIRPATAGINVRRDNWDTIIVHHSAIKYGNAAAYDREHRRRGMQHGLAYHFVIGNGIDSGDGEIEIGPRWTKQLHGGHVKSYQVNLTAIGICLVGNFEETRPTSRQLEALTQLVSWLRRDVVPKAQRFAGHRQIQGEQTVCPGRYFPLAELNRRFS